MYTQLHWPFEFLPFKMLVTPLFALVYKNVSQLLAGGGVPTSKREDKDIVCCHDPSTNVDCVGRE